MNRRLVSLLVALALAFPAPACAQATKTKTQKLPAAKANPADPPRAQNRTTRFLTDGDFAVVVLHPNSFFTDPANDLLPVEIITAMGLKEGGIDPLQIERITFTFSRIDRFPQPPEVSGVMEMSQPIDPTKVFSRQAQWGEPQKLPGGATVRRSQRLNEPSLAFVDDRTILFALDEQLDRVLAAAAPAPADSPIARRLASYDGKSHLFAAVDLDAVREPLSMLKQMAAQVPPQFQEFFKLPDLLTAVELKLSITGSTTAELVLHGRDEPAAAEAERLVNQALLMAREMALASMAQNMRGPDQELQQATARWLRRISEKVVKSLTPTRDRTRVTITASVDSGYAGLAVMPALLLPAINAARAAAQRSASINNMRQIALAMQNYEAGHRKFPNRANLDENGKPLLSWRVHILPFIEEEELYKQFKLDEPWDSEHNKKLLVHMPGIYANPAANLADRTTYMLPTGAGTAWSDDNGLRVRDIKDGTSNTIALLEVDADKAVEWTKPGDLEIDPEDPLAGLGGLHAGNVFGAAFFDGSVRPIVRDLDARTFLQLLNPRDGRVVDIP